jgi:GYF domain 2
MSDVWFYHDGRGQVGPLSKEDLIATLSTYRNPQSIFVWRSGLDEWKRAGEIPELLSSLMPPPPIDATPPPSVTGGADQPLAFPRIDSQGRGPTKHRFNNFIAKSWRGEYPLGITYWVFGFAANLLAGAIVAGVGAILSSDTGYQPRNIFVAMTTIWLSVLALAIWQLVGVWRSASRRIEQRKRIGKLSIWAGLAKVAVVLGCLSFLVEFGNSGLPQLTEAWRMAFLNDPNIPDYAIRIMRDGKEVEVAGGFKFGLTDDFKKILRASPQISVVHLNSAGGRIGEAQSLYGVIRDNRLITYTSSRCLSACTLAFAAGRERWIHRRGKLGFHSPTFPGMKEADLREASQLQREAFVLAGFDRGFVDRALSTPNKDMWTPSIEELSRAQVVTAISDGNDFAASGFGVDVTQEALGSALAERFPLFQTLRVKMPSQFALLVEAYHTSYLAGQTENQMIAAARSKFIPILAAQRALADDDVLIDLGRLYADQYEAVGAVDPTACYHYASGVAGSSGASLVPSDLLTRELMLNERVIRTVAERPRVTEQMTAPLWDKVRKQLAAKGHGLSGIELLQRRNLEKSRHSEFCRVSVALMREVASMRPWEAALLFREIWSAN